MPHTGSVRIACNGNDPGAMRTVPIASWQFEDFGLVFAHHLLRSKGPASPHSRMVLLPSVTEPRAFPARCGVTSVALDRVRPFKCRKPMRSFA